MHHEKERLWGGMIWLLIICGLAIIMKGTKVLTLSAHNHEKMMTTPYHQHSYLSSSVPVSQLMHSCHALSLAMHYTAP